MLTSTISKPIPLVKDIMHEGAIRIAAHSTAQDVARIFSENRISGAPVVDADGAFIGVISLADLVRSLQPDARLKEELHFYRHIWFESDPAADKLETLKEATEALAATARDLMTPTIVGVDENAPLTEAMRLMLEHKIHRVFVKREDNIIGLVSTMDVMKALASLLESPAEK